MEFKSLLGPDDPKKDRDGNDGTTKSPGNEGDFPKLPRTTRRPGRTGPLWAAVGLLGAGLVAASAWGYQQLQADRDLFSAFADSSIVDAIEVRVDSLDNRLSTLVGRVATSDTVEGLASRIAGVESRVTRALEATRADIAQVAEANADMDWRIQSAVEARTSPIRERLAELEAAEQSRMADLVALEDQIAALGLDLETGLTKLREDEATANAGLEGRLSGTERRLDIVAYAVDRDRVDFEMYQSDNEEIAPGIVLHLQEVDRRYQRVQGWIWLVPEARFVRFEDHPIQESLVFYTHQDERPHELVFTRVTETAAVGYMRIPSESIVETADEAWDAPPVAVAARE